MLRVAESSPTVAFRAPSGLALRLYPSCSPPCSYFTSACCFISGGLCLCSSPQVPIF